MPPMRASHRVPFVKLYLWNFLKILDPLCHVSRLPHSCNLHLSGIIAIYTHSNLHALMGCEGVVVPTEELKSPLSISATCHINGTTS